MREEKPAPHEEVLYLTAGLGDLLVEGLRGVTRRLPGLSQVRHELRARGELAVKRMRTTPEPHLELLARQVVERGPHE
ncbi:hypothetical protein [Sphaerisporangium fuscum]|uniref:hypothetical protein n=1 Tax=Sphaerisporangium fuscum TaxID=2835868 RepID=UPI001BDCA86A|nr:hypothetical protein [Sphaerisporangium fuscum]